MGCWTSRFCWFVGHFLFLFPSNTNAEYFSHKFMVFLYHICYIIDILTEVMINCCSIDMSTAFILPKTLSTTFVETADFLRAGFLLSIPLSAPFGVPIWGFCNSLSFEILLSILGFYKFARTLLIVYLIYKFRVCLVDKFNRYYISYIKNFVCLNIISIFQIS